MSKALDLAKFVTSSVLTANDLTGYATTTGVTTAIDAIEGGVALADEYYLTANETLGLGSPYVESAVTRSAASFGDAMTVTSEQDGSNKWGRTFSFPSVGTYRVTFQAQGNNGSSDMKEAFIKKSTDGGVNYTTTALGYSDSVMSWANNVFSVLVVVTDISLDKVRFGFQNVSNNLTLNGNSSMAQTSFSFIKLN